MFIDISRTLSPKSVVFPGDKQLRFVSLEELGPHSDFAKIGIEHFSGHVMTHIDMPSHVLKDGKTLDDYDVSRFVFDAVVYSVETDVIDAAVVKQLGDVENKAVLFKTRCSAVGDSEPFAYDFVYINAEGAEALSAARVSAVGIDYLSIDSLETSVAHRTLMKSDVMILEALQLWDAAPGEYTLFAFPLKIESGDGSCVRAVLQAR